MTLEVMNGPVSGQGAWDFMRRNYPSCRDLQRPKVYQDLGKLDSEGLVEVADEITGKTGRPQQRYRLTGAGRSALSDAAEQLMGPGSQGAAVVGELGMLLDLVCLAARYGGPGALHTLLERSQGEIYARVHTMLAVLPSEADVPEYAAWIPRYHDAAIELAKLLELKILTGWLDAIRDGVPAATRRVDERGEPELPGDELGAEVEEDGGGRFAGLVTRRAIESDEPGAPND